MLYRLTPGPSHDPVVLCEVCSRLRVMGGSAKGRRLDSPDVQLRPMMGKVKEALFSTLTGFGLFDREDTKVRGREGERGGNWEGRFVRQ